jgi:hypothetical protein
MEIIKIVQAGVEGIKAHVSLDPLDIEIQRKKYYT